MATKNKPLMIRGDQLMLVLDAIQYAGQGFCTYTEDRHWSYDRVARALGRLGFPTKAVGGLEMDSPNQLSNTLAPLFGFIEPNLALVAPFTFDVRRVLDELSQSLPFEESVSPFERLLCAVASGELTEADFKE